VPVRDYEFDQFRLTPELYELTRAGRPVRLEKIPFDLLVLLVERRPGLVSRDVITAALWGNGGFQDLDQSLNTAIRKVRLALRDSADEPHFVQTVVGRGYRFLPEVRSKNVWFRPKLPRRRYRRRSPCRSLPSRVSDSSACSPAWWCC
jgi:DNA-binding winged helix-turn-helix (wHTH) protein